MSKAQEIRQRRREARTRQNQRRMLGGVALVAIAIAAFLIYQGMQVAQQQAENAKPVGDFVTVEKEDFPLADGKSLGNPEARVVIKEFSDFQ